MGKDELFKNKQPEMFTPINETRNEQAQRIQTEKAQIWQQFQQDSTTFLQDRRTLFGNPRDDSPEMQDIKHVLRDLLNELNTPLRNSITLHNATADDDDEDFEEDAMDDYETGLDTIKTLYDELADACHRYIAAKGTPLTIHGRTRKRMVKQLLAQVERERPMLQTCAEQLFRKNEICNWSDVLWQMRSNHFEIPDTMSVQSLDPHNTTLLLTDSKKNTLRFQRDMTAFSYDSAAIAAAVQKDGDIQRAYQALTEATVNGIARDKLQLNASEHRYDQANTACYALSFIVNQIRGMGLDAPDTILSQQDIRDFFNAIDLHVQFTDQSYLRTPEGFQAMLRLCTKVGSHIPQIDDSSRLQIDIAQHAVAASRIASVLGVGELFPQASLVTVQHAGAQMTGSIVREPAGTPLSKLMEQSKGKKAHPLEYSPEAMQQLSTLYVIDWLFGINHRDPSTIIARYREQNGRRIITGITTTGNLSAFQPVAQQESILPNLSVIDQNLLSALQSDALMAELDYALADLLRFEQRSALQENLNLLREQLPDALDTGMITPVAQTEWAQQGPALATMSHTASTYLVQDLFPAAMREQVRAHDQELSKEIESETEIETETESEMETETES